MTTEENIYNKHLDKIIKNKSFSSKFGYLIFGYPRAKNKKSKYSVKNVNIGDYIQSLAAQQFIPSADVPLERDLLKNYDGEPVNTILNSWYHIDKDNDVFSEKINPLLVSIHINNTEDITQATLSYFKKHEPIGCRDYATMEFLQKHDIESYFSGCLTTTLDVKYKAEESQRNNKILFVDFKFNENKNIFSKNCKYYDKINKLIKNLLKNTGIKNITNIEHDVEFGKTPDEYFNIAKNLLKEYATAKLVITTRIHSALPCLALGTPVILIVKNYDKKRFKGIADLLNFVGYDENKKLIMRIKKDNNGNIINPTEHIKYADKLKKICKEFCSP